MALSASAGPGHALPEAVQAGLLRLAADGLWYAPVRHHSPACALALQALIAEVKPAAILIEGPDDFAPLLPLLLDERTRPPVAVLSQAAPGPRVEEGADDDDSLPASSLRSVFFPFCDYSPEWVALREGSRVGAQLAFIDCPWHQLPEPLDAGEEARSLMSERYLAHSRYLQELAARSSCRDQDELWDHLFELRAPDALRDWRRLFADVFAYCAMARADYEPEVLEADGSLPRERHMAAHIRRWRDQVAGPIVVVTGGFHTIALQELLAAPRARAQRGRAGAAAGAPAPAATTPAAGAQHGNWLIRYSFDRLDALNGYAAGMPAPAYYQWVWDSANASIDGPHMRDIAADCLTHLAGQTRALGLADTISTADVHNAVLQACRLSNLRGHAGPGRQDLLDALRSCFVKGADEDAGQLAADIRRFLGGTRLGDIPPSAGSPPLLEDARRVAARLGVRLDDSAPRTVRLDLYRKARHRERSRFLHLMAYLDTGVGRWESGPDFVHGTRLELLIEEWRVAWSPLVEARLIELAPQGATLLDAAMARLRQEEQALAGQGQGRSAGQAVGLLTRACVIGLHERLLALLSMLAAYLQEDGNAVSVTACAHRLLILWRAREPLGVQDHPHLHALLLQAWAAALYLAPQLADVKADGERQAIDSLLSLRSLGQALHHMPGTPGAGMPAERAEWPQWPLQLERITAREDAAPGVACAAATLLFLDGYWSEEQLGHLVRVSFGPGAQGDAAVRALKGIMTAAPELLITQARLRNEVTAIFARWDEQTFIAYLPDLRQAFAQMKPQETARLAESIAAPLGADPLALAATHYGAGEADLLAGAALQAALAACLMNDALGDGKLPDALRTEGTA